METLETTVTSHNQKELDLSAVDEIVARYREERGALIPVLQEVQGHYGYIPPEAVSRVAEGLKIYPSKIYGVMTFYKQFYLKAKGKNRVMVCCGTACHVKGSDRVTRRVLDEIKLPDGQDTTEDGLFTIEQVACIGACSIAPVVVVNEKVHGKMTQDKTMRELRKITEAADE